MAGKTIRTRAVVASALRYGESDLIVAFLTEDHGLVKGIAKGALKSKKRFVGCFEPFTMLELGFAPSGSGGLVRVYSADVIETYRGMRDDLDRIEAGAVVLELTAALEPPFADSKDAGPAFSLLHETLKMMAASVDPHALAAAFCVKFLTLSGYMAPLRSCSGCGATLSGKAAEYAGGGAFLCPDCAGAKAGGRAGQGRRQVRSAGPGLSRGTVAFVSRAQSIDASKTCRLRASGEVIAETYAFLKVYAEDTAGIRLKSLKRKNPSTFS